MATLTYWGYNQDLKYWHPSYNNGYFQVLFPQRAHSPFIYKNNVKNKQMIKSIAHDAK